MVILEEKYVWAYELIVSNKKYKFRRLAMPTIPHMAESTYMSA
jgi:hypothetical protein